MNRGLIGVFCFVFCFAFVHGVSAVSIFSDGFESGNLNGWELSSSWNGTNWTAVQNNSNTGLWHAESNPRDNHINVSVMHKIIDTTSYQNITVRYFRKLTGLDAGDSFRVKWFNGVSWTYIENTVNTTDQTYISRYFDLPASAINNPNFKLRFECSADAQSEFCRVDDVLVEGDAISAVSGNYYGYFNYMNGYDYFVYINGSTNTISFSGLNASNQNENHVLSYDSSNRFSKRLNYVWFSGWFNNQNLYLNQYVETGISHIRNSLQTLPGVYSTVLTFPSLPYLGVSNMSTYVIIDSNLNQSTFAPILYPQLNSTSPINSIFSTAGHSFGSMLFQTRLVYNGTGYDIEVQEWVKEDLAPYGLAPRWNVSLNSL